MRRDSSRSEIRESAASSAAALRRPSMVLMGRTRPSRPSRLPTISGRSLAERRRSLPTVFELRPVRCAMTRSDQCGWLPMMRWAAALRSSSVSGSPCRTFNWTERTKASASLPSKNRTGTSVRPLITAARNRCMPSITRMVGRCTRSGSGLASVSARRRTCAGFSRCSRGESEGRRSPMGTVFRGRS
ncbi:hypothetical protein [Streptomyces thioluteus]|uniref:hypothetical protein n=1 Tax=Streptomyces thioluteus TaxID=66431 RepID=UPI0031E6ADD3